jgi:RNA recognition motif-containing protein
MVASTTSNRIWVGRICRKTSIDEVKSVFGQYGKIVDFKFIPKGEDAFVFIEYSSEEEAARAIKLGDGRKVDGSTLKVNSANPIRDNKEIKDKDEKKRLETSTTRSSFYSDEKDSSRNRRRSRSRDNSRTRARSRSHSREKKRLFKLEITNLPRDMTWQELKRLGGDYGKSLEYARVVAGKDSVVGFLEYAERKDAVKVIESLDGKRMEDSDRRLRVSWDDSDDERNRSTRKRSASPVERRRR